MRSDPMNDYVSSRLFKRSEGRIFSTAAFSVNKSVSYRGHAAAVYSIDQAVEFLDFIGIETGSDNYLPFSMSLVDGNGQYVSIAEDNGEFGGGEMLGRALQDLDGFNALVCVSRHVAGVYVAEVAQNMKFKVIQDAATGALSLLYNDLVKKANEKELEETRLEHEKEIQMTRSLVGDTSISIGSEDNTSGPKKYKGSGPGGKETIFERTERQALERFRKQMQLEQEKALKLANRPTLDPSKKMLALPKGTIPYTIAKNPDSSGRKKH